MHRTTNIKPLVIVTKDTLNTTNRTTEHGARYLQY